MPERRIGFASESAVVRALNSLPIDRVAHRVASQRNCAKTDSAIGPAERREAREKQEERLEALKSMLGIDSAAKARVAHALLRGDDLNPDQLQAVGRPFLVRLYAMEDVLREYQRVKEHLGGLRMAGA